jgi:hypothetical protein
MKSQVSRRQSAGSREIELGRVFGIDSCRIMAGKEIACETKTPYVI